MSTDTISVIIPVYNTERYVGEAIRSVLAQTHPADEIIVVDDGSTDGSAAVAQGFASVRYFYRENGGIGAARNTGIEAAQGELIAFLDADDCWTPDKLARQMAAREESGAEMIFGHVRHFHSPDLDPQLARQIYCEPELMPGYIAGTLLLRRAAFLEVGWFGTQWRVGEFIDWYSRALDCGLSQFMLPDVLLRRRLHSANTGIVQRAQRSDYAHILKAALERRRAERES